MSQQPKRVQRKRTKGWRMPEGVVYVGRGSKWGNPWKVGNGFVAAEVVALYEFWMRGNYDDSSLSARPDLRQLRGKNLACWCPLDKPCHADVLIEMANLVGPREA